MLETIQLIQSQPDEIAAGAAPYVLYLGDEFYCTYDSCQQAAEEIAALRRRWEE